MEEYRHLRTHKHLWARYLATLIYDFFTNANKYIILATEDKAHNSQTFSACLKKYFTVKISYVLFKSASLHIYSFSNTKNSFDMYCDPSAIEVSKLFETLVHILEK